MKGLLFLVVVCAVAAVSYGKYCTHRNATNPHSAPDDPSSCGFTCQSGETPSCEHGGICSCAKSCNVKTDCDPCTSSVPDHMNPGHMVQEEVHCFNNYCTCDPPGHMPPPDHHHQPPDQHHQGGHQP